LPSLRRSRLPPVQRSGSLPWRASTTSTPWWRKTLRKDQHWPRVATESEGQQPIAKGHKASTYRARYPFTMQQEQAPSAEDGVSLAVPEVLQDDASQEQRHQSSADGGGAATGSPTGGAKTQGVRHDHICDRQGAWCPVRPVGKPQRPERVGPPITSPATTSSAGTGPSGAAQPIAAIQASQCSLRMSVGYAEPVTSGRPVSPGWLTRSISTSARSFTVVAAT